MKELSLKQLYGYSIMNWDIYLTKIDMAENERSCSFCRDLKSYEDDACEGCRINPFICSKEGSKGYFHIIDARTNKLYSKISTIIQRLKFEYNKL